MRYIISPLSKSGEGVGGGVLVSHSTENRYNAGFGNYGLFNETNLNNELEMLQVNLVCLTYLTKLFLKQMVKQGSGKILNVSSAAAFQPCPLMAVYFATKAYILSFSEAIANELEGTGVTVTIRGRNHFHFPYPTVNNFWW